VPSSKAKAIAEIRDFQRLKSPDEGLLRSVFSKHRMSLNRVINADGLSSTCAAGICVEKWGLDGFQRFLLAFGLNFVKIAVRAATKAM